MTKFDPVRTLQVAEQCFPPQPTCALSDAGRSRRLGSRARRALSALAVNGTTTTVITHMALQHGQEAASVGGVEGVGSIVGAVDDTKAGQDVALGDEPLLGGVVGGGAAHRALLAGFAAALGGVEAGGTARGTYRGGSRQSIAAKLVSKLNTTCAA